MTIEISSSNSKPYINRDFNREELDLLKSTICKGSTDLEFKLFVDICKRTGLDPFMKQVYAIKRWSASEKREVMSVQTSIDGYRLVAERTGQYSPGKESTHTYDTNGKLLCSTSYIKKRTNDGTWHEIASSAYYQEYVQKNKEGKTIQFWERMPHVMLAKCAEALALRKAFPAELSGLYTAEEMAQATPEVSKERTEITEAEWATLDVLVQQIDNQEYLDKLVSHIEIPTIWDLKPKDFDRVMRSIQKKALEKGASNGSEIVA